jgi:hypothetical protein
MTLSAIRPIPVLRASGNIKRFATPGILADYS